MNRFARESILVQYIQTQTLVKKRIVTLNIKLYR